MFRSGSTLTEQVLAGHSRVTAGGEIDVLPSLVRTELAPFPARIAQLSPRELDELASRYTASLSKLFPGAAYVTDKRPDNFLHIGLIKSLFPEAKIVHTTRNALDNCLSIYFLHLDHNMGYALDLMDIAHYYRQYRRLMAHWKSQYGADILDFDYDTFVRAPRRGRAEAARLLRPRLGGGLPRLPACAQRSQDGERLAGARAALPALFRPLAKLCAASPLARGVSWRPRRRPGADGREHPRMSPLCQDFPVSRPE